MRRHLLAVVLAMIAGCSSSAPAPKPAAGEVKEPPAACQGDACVEGFRTLLRKSPPDYVAAERFASDACDRGVEDMCSRLGRLHALPLYPGSDPARSLAAFEQSCKRGHQRGCLGVGKVIMVHPELGEKAGGSARAVKLFRDSCEAGIGQGCYYLGMFYFLGREVPRDQKKAIELLGKRVELLASACDGGDGFDCGILAEAYTRGEVVVGGALSQKPDPAKAAEYARKGCEAEHGGSCLVLGRLTLERDRIAAIELFARGCELLDPDSCTELGRHGATAAERPRLYHRACQLGAGSGCFALAGVTQQGGKDAAAQRQARDLQLRGCQLGYPPSCRFHANMVRIGHGGAADPAAARAALVRVCEMIESGTFCADAECVVAISSSCADAGEMIKNGEGGPADPERGKALLQIACDRGLDKACAAAKD